MEWQALLAALIPIAIAAVFRVPRRTELLAKEVEILGGLPHASEAHVKLAEHIEQLVDREIESNRRWISWWDTMFVLAALAYGASLLAIAMDKGGWWWIGGAVGGLPIAGFAVVAGIWLFGVTRGAFAWLKQRFRGLLVWLKQRFRRRR